MTVAEAIEVQADYHLRGPDFETMLVGPITATMIDADRLVRMEWQNGMPNWAMFRCCYAGDTHLRKGLREFCVAFAAAYLETSGAVRPHVVTDDFACLAGWDAYCALLTGKWVASGAEVAEIAEVDPKTYRKVRGAVYARLRASLWEYWIRMQVAYRQVALIERKQEDSSGPRAYNMGRAFDGDMGLNGDGNYITPRRGSNC
jgi:hypothetical protein